MYWQLFISFLKIGCLGFGGGLSIIALIEQEVTSHGWISSSEFVDMVAISQITPGPVGLNCATYVGYHVTGSIWGSLFASAAIIIPSLVIMLTLCIIYMRVRDRWAQHPVFVVTMRVIRILIVLLVAHAAISLCTPESFIDWRSWVIFVVALLATISAEVKRHRVTDIISHPIVLIVLAGVAGWAIYG